MADVDEPIYLSAFDQQWRGLFEAEARRISAVLPSDIAIEHIGSTAVSGLVSKPIIDLMLGANLHASAEVRARLVNLDYEDLGEAGVAGRIYLRRRLGTAFNIALVEHGGSHWRSNLAFRDYLRANPEAVNEYAEIKRRAYDSGIRTLLAYSDYKNTVVTGLMHRALAKSCGKTPNS